MRRFFHRVCIGLAAGFCLPAPAQDAVRAVARDHQEIPKPAKVEPDTRGTVAIEFRGATSFSAEDLRTAIAEQIQDIENLGLTRARADDAAFFLGNHYRENGYAEVEVLWQIVSARSLLLNVREGPVIIIRNVRFEGNRAVSEETLREHFMGATRERFPEREGDFPLVEADIQTGVETVRGLYAAEGLLNATVADAEFTFARRPPKADITVRIREGIQFTWGVVTFAGAPLFADAELVVCLGECEGRPYTPNQLFKAQRDLQYHYKKHGYFDAQVTAVGAPERARGGRVPVSFSIQAGRQYRFGDVTVTGLSRLDEDFLPARFRTIKGEIYSPETAQKKFRDMMRTGLFKNLRLHEEPLPNGEVRLDLIAEEAKSRELGFSLGYSTFEGGIGGITWRDRNLFGHGRPFSAEIKAGQRGLLGEVLYTDPWLFEDKYTGRLRLYGTTRMFEGYDKQEYGLRAELTRKLGERSEMGVFLQGRQTAIKNVTFQPTLEGRDAIRRLPRDEQEAATDAAVADLVGPTDYSIVSAGLIQTWDRRDSPLNPTRGWLISSTLEYAADALGDGVSFLRGSLAVSYYRPLGKGVLALGARAGILDSMGDEAIPVDERFFSGGARSVRSFAERELGPLDAQGLPLGGESFAVFNVEYTFPIYKALEGALFYDAGSVGKDAGFGDLRHGIGIGLRYKTPIGPLRIDYGFNPSPTDRESSGAFHVGIGVAF